MATEKHTEYLATLGAMDRNTTRRAFMHLGRYHGFDTIASGSGSLIPVQVSHTETCDYIDNTNSPVSVAVFITGHGIVVTTDATPTVEVALNSSGATKYQILYAEYTWADIGGGSSVTYGVDSQLASVPTVPSGLTDVQTPLGYFTVPDGSTVFADITYTPYPVPNIAGKADPDLTPYALLAGNNDFTGLNNLSETDLPKASVVEDAANGGDPYYNLVLSEDANVFNIAALDTKEYRISNILFSGSRTAKDGEIFFLYFEASGATVAWYATNLYVPSAYKSTYLNQGALFLFVRINGYYYAMAMPTTLQAHITALASRVTTLETEISSLDDRVGTLENASLVWTDIIAPATVVGEWTINYFKTANYKGLTYIKAYFSTSAGGAVSGDTLLGTYDFGGLITALVMASYNGANSHITLGLHSSNNMYIYNGTVTGINTFFLPPTVIK